MKKLNLNVANLGATEILSREELKKVLGGTGTGTGSGSGIDIYSCGTSPFGCDHTKKCKPTIMTTGTCGLMEINGNILCACIED